MLTNKSISYFSFYLNSIISKMYDSFNIKLTIL